MIYWMHAEKDQQSRSFSRSLHRFQTSSKSFQQQLIKRIPMEFRSASYAMLDIVLRSEMPIHPYYFWLATACASCHTLRDCISKIPSKAYLASYQIESRFGDIKMFGPKAPNSFYVKLEEAVGSNEQCQYRLKSRCDGLIEEVPYKNKNGCGDSTVIQFMHQTVKDFVSKPGFRQFITNEDNESKENGYSFLAKYNLAQPTLERRRLSMPGYSSLLEYSTLLNWFYYLRYASRAESTLDIAYMAVVDSTFKAGNTDEPEEAHRLILLLLDHGGSVTEAGASSVSTFLRCLTSHDAFPLASLDGRLKNPPRLQTLPAMTIVNKHPKVDNSTSSPSFLSPNNDALKSSRFKKVLPGLFKRNLR